MKKFMSFALAVCMCVPLVFAGLVPVSGAEVLADPAEESALPADGTLLYSENFDSYGTTLLTSTTLSALNGTSDPYDIVNWSALSGSASVTITSEGKLKVAGGSSESYLQILSGEGMDRLAASGSYTVSYEMTLTSASSVERYSSLLLNYADANNYNWPLIRVKGIGFLRNYTDGNSVSLEDDGLKMTSANLATLKTDNGHFLHSLCKTTGTTLLTLLHGTDSSISDTYDSSASALLNQTLQITLESVQGAGIIVWVNGVVVTTTVKNLSYFDSSIRKTGTAVLRTSANTTAVIDRLEVRAGANVTVTENEFGFTVMSVNTLFSNTTGTDANDIYSMHWIVGQDENGENILRYEALLEVISALHPDIVGFQERNYNFPVAVNDAGKVTSTASENTIVEQMVAMGYGIIENKIPVNTSGAVYDAYNWTPIFYDTAKFLAMRDSNDDNAFIQSGGTLENYNMVANGCTLYGAAYAGYTDRLVNGEKVTVNVLLAPDGVNPNSTDYYPYSISYPARVFPDGAVTKTVTELRWKSGKGYDTYYPVTLEDTEGYLDCTALTAAQMASIVTGSDGTITYNGTSYAGAYYTRNLQTVISASTQSKGVTWCVLQVRATGQKLLMMNTHVSLGLSTYYCNTDGALTNALVLEWQQSNGQEILNIAEKVYDCYGEMPTICVGDFNMQNSNPMYSMMTSIFDDVARLSPGTVFWEYSHHTPVTSPILDDDGNQVYADTFEDKYSITQPQFAYTQVVYPTPAYPIDHIFASADDFTVNSYNVLNDVYEEGDSEHPYGNDELLITDHCALLTNMTLKGVQTPDCSHSSGIYTEEQTVTLTAGNRSDLIYFTLDGTDPTVSDTRQLYTGAFSVRGDKQLRAASCRNGVWSSVHIVNFAVAGEIAITKIIKNTYQSGREEDLLEGLEIVNTSAHTVDLGDYTFWQYSSTSEEEVRNPSSYSLTTEHLRVAEKGRYILQPGEVYYVWLVFSDMYKVPVTVSAGGSAVYLVDFVTEEGLEDPETLELWESLGYTGLDGDAVGKVIYRTDYVSLLMAYSNFGNVEADHIIPLDRTTGSFRAASGSYEEYRRKDLPATSTGPTNLSYSFNLYNTSYARMMITYSSEVTAENAFSVGLAINPSDGNTKAFGTNASSPNARTGALSLAILVDRETGALTSVPTEFYSDYQVGRLTEAQTDAIYNVAHRTVTFSVDGTDTEVSVVAGDIPVYEGTPEKVGDIYNNYAFERWVPEIVPCMEDAVYTATFVVTSVNYVITLLADGEITEQLVGDLGDVKTLPTGSAHGGVFLGWKNTETNALYGAGTTFTLTENMVFEAMFLDFVTEAGAAVRTTKGSTGLRFLTTVEREGYDALLGSVGEVAMGTFIVPQYYVETAGDFDISLFKKYLNVKTSGFYRESTATYTLAGSVVNIYENHYDMAYAARAYLSFTYADGTPALIYATLPEGGSRTVKNVARAAYRDRSEVCTPAYPYETERGDWSRYTAEQLSVLCGFFADEINVYFVNGAYVTDDHNLHFAWDYNDLTDTLILTRSDGEVWDLQVLFLDGEETAFEIVGNRLIIRIYYYTDRY